MAEGEAHQRGGASEGAIREGGEEVGRNIAKDREVRATAQPVGWRDQLCLVHHNAGPIGDAEDHVERLGLGVNDRVGDREDAAVGGDDVTVPRPQDFAVLAVDGIDEFGGGHRDCTEVGEGGRDRGDVR